MLPPVPAIAAPALPVPATPSASQANPRQASPSPEATGAPAQDGAPTPASPAPTHPGTTSSLDLLDLSGQLRLGQSLSISAETLGSLLDLPRHEGEALADYSRRLAAAIQALPGAERARLQALLDQSMQGITLKLLSELLKDPTGPAAARLAVRMEIARHGGTDLAAGRAVQSYRQNNGSSTGGDTGGNHSTLLTTDNSGADERPGPPASIEARAALQAKTMADGQSAARPTVLAPMPAFAATTAAVDEGSMTVPADAPPVGVSNGDRGPGDDAVGARMGEPGQSDGEPDFVRTGPRPSPASLSALPTGPDARAPGSISRDLGMPARPDTQTVMGGTRDDAATQSADAADTTAASASRNEGPIRTGGIYDAAALARRAHAQDGFPNLSTPTTVDFPTSDQTSDMHAENTDSRALRPIPASPPGVATGVNDAVAGKGHLEDGGTTGSRKQPADAVDPNPATPQPVVLPMSAALPNAAILARQAGTAFEKALLGMMLPAREPPTHPHVPHVAAQEFDDERDHEVRRKPAIGDDGQPSRQGFGGGHSSRQEEQPAGDTAAADTVLDQIVIDDTDEATDNEPVTAELRLAPQQHLSSHVAPTAEDFYRRLAILE